jgi:tRNA (adenine57-N1/adenine58-N1)-methyltransferase
VAAASDRTGGRLVSFERRDDFAEVARANVETFFG